MPFQDLEPTARERLKALIAGGPEFDTFAESCSRGDRPKRRAAEHYINLPHDVLGFDEAPLSARG